LAIVVVVTHCVAIFWPRKPLKVPTDENGLPVLWRNESEQSKDVACVWWDDAEDATASQASAETAPASLPMTSFSKTVNPLGVAATEGRRSVA
jgi:hypothetical protein